MAVFPHVHLPSLGGATAWLNTEPLGPAELRGHVVLVNFWTWTFYFVDADGIIRDQHFGEGRYERSERVIQRLLGIEREAAPVEGLGVEAEADWDHVRTPETYLGYASSEHFGSADGTLLGESHAYELPERLRFNHWALAGEWTIGPENVVLDKAGGSIALRFHARDAHLVLSPGAREAIPFRVLLDGEAPGLSGGVDVDQDGTGLLRDARMYQLVREHDAVRDRTLELTSSSPAPRRTRSPSGSQGGRRASSARNVTWST
jgi:Thioredoxin like C-terminal domain